MTCVPLLLSLLTTPCVPGAIATLEPPPTVTTPRDRPPVEVHAGIGYESLTAGRSDWTDASVRVKGGVAPGIGLHAEAVRTERFDLVDTQLRVGASVRLAGAWSGDGEVAVSPTGNVLPDVSAAATLHRQLGGGWVVGVGGRHDAHDVGAVNIGTLIADYYVGGYRLNYTLSMAFVDGTSAPGHSGSASRYYGDGSAVTVLAAAGESVDRVTPQDLLVTDVVVLSLWGVHWVSPRLGLTYGAAFNHHVDLYDRRRVEVGWRVRF
jgi:YaiO family outer membrane protein